MNTTTLERTPLTSIVGTVLEKGAAAPGRSAKIKLTSGLILSAFPDKMAQIVEGGTYDFGCEVVEKSGVIYNNVKAIKPALAPQSSTPPRSQPARQAPAPQRSALVNQHVTPPQNGTPAPQNGNGNGGSYYRPTSPKDARRMFICSQMNALIQSHQIATPINAQSIADTIAMLEEAYDATLGQEDAA